MTPSTKYALTVTASAAVLGLAAQGARAQAAAQPAPQGPPPSVSEIVVTGTAGGSGVKKLDAGYAVTTMSANQIQLMSPKTSGEILQSVPGVWVESSGGVGTSNIFVRGIPSTGDAPFVSQQFNGVTVYGMSSPSFMDQSALVRDDLTIDGVEAVNGGPASVFADGQPGLTVNWKLKRGGDDTSGELKVSGTTFGQYRIDGVLSGKIADDLYFMIGGYVTDGPSVRDAGFDTENGKQFTVNITKEFERGEFEVFARYTDDHGEWYVPFSIGVPGLNLGTYNPLNQYTRYGTIQTGPNSTQTIDVGDGRGWKGIVAGGHLNYDVGDGFTFRDRFGVTSGDLNTFGLVNDGNAMPVSAVLAANPGLTSITTVHTDQTLSPTDYVQNFGAWMALKHLNYVSNEMSIEKEIANNKITLGYYFTRYSSDDNWSLGNDEAIEVGGAGDQVSVTPAQIAAAGSGSTAASSSLLPNGNGAFYALQDSGTATANALYLSDSWQATDRLRIDAGVRWEEQHINFVDHSGPGYVSLLPQYAGSADVTSSRVSWTAGANYKIESDMDVYVRASEGVHMPSFDDVRSNIGNTGVPVDKPWTVYSYEGGWKFHNHAFDAGVTVFYDDVIGAVYNDVDTPTVIAGSHTYGVEIDGRWTSDFGLSILTNDVFEEPKTYDPIDPNYNGKQAERIPKYQFRITPDYQFKVGPAKVSLYGTFMAIGSRYSDLGNTQALPAFQTVNAGIIVDYGQFEFQVAGDNLANSHGLTEGDPRGVGDNDGLPASRPIFGRSADISLAWKF